MQITKRETRFTQALCVDLARDYPCSTCSCRTAARGGILHSMGPGTAVYTTVRTCCPHPSPNVKLCPTQAYSCRRRKESTSTPHQAWRTKAPSSCIMPSPQLVHGEDQHSGLHNDDTVSLPSPQRCGESPIVITVIVAVPEQRACRGFFRRGRRADLHFGFRLLANAAGRRTCRRRPFLAAE